MPLYRVTRKAYLPIPNAVPGLSRFYEPDETIEFAGTPGRALEPLDDAARTAKAARDAAVPFTFLPNELQARGPQGDLLNASITTMRHKPSEPE